MSKQPSAAKLTGGGGFVFEDNVGLFEMLNDGHIADMAWSGFLKARKLGTARIMEVPETGKMPRSNSPLER
jgi:hypothetical protein